MKKIIASSLILAMLSSSAIMCGALSYGTAYDTSLPCDKFLYLCEDACQEFADSIEAAKSIQLPQYEENPITAMVNDITKTATQINNAAAIYKVAERNFITSDVSKMIQALNELSRAKKDYYNFSVAALTDLRLSLVSANEYSAHISKSLQEIQNIYDQGYILQDNLLAIYNPQNPHGVPYGTQSKLADDVNDCYLAAADVKKAVNSLPYKLEHYQDAYDGLCVKTYQLMGTIDNLVEAFNGGEHNDIEGANKLNKLASSQLADFCVNYADIFCGGTKPIEAALDNLSTDFDFSTLSQINFDNDTDAMVQQFEAIWA